MVDTEESLTSDADLFYSTLLQDIRTKINLCEMCKTIQCISLEDFISNYSIILNCVVNHKFEICDSNLDDLFCKLFLVENYLLRYIVEPDIVHIKDAIFGKYNNSKIRHAIAICSEKYYKSNINTLSCEQDVESLFFKIYKKIILANKNNEKKINDDTFSGVNDLSNGNVSNTAIECLLFVLFIRKEYLRFFKIYRQCEHTVFTYRLAIYLSMNEDCEYEVETEDVERVSYVDVNIVAREAPDIIELLDLKNKKQEEWLEKAKVQYEWNEKLHLWMKNRRDASGLLDKSMLEECAKYNRFEDGWTIYSYGNRLAIFESLKILTLCLRAAVKSNDDLWLNRLYVVIDEVINKHDLQICCCLVQDVFYTLGNVTESLRSKIVKFFIKKIRVMENNEEIVTNIIKGINELCKKCVNTETCDICVEHAILLYNEWKKNNTGGFFFKSHSKYENEIYENMLDMCDTIDDCNGYKNVCKDLVENEAKINRGIFRKLQLIHNKVCKECKHDNFYRQKMQDEQQLLYHIFNRLSMQSD